MTNETAQKLTLMTVHAHPDDETIGTGGVMAKAIQAGHRVVLVTCTRGEQGEIVVPEMDTPDNHRRLGELRAAELEAALGALRGYGHPDHIRTHDVAVRAYARAGDPAWYPQQLAPEHGGTGPAEADGGVAPWAPLKLYEQAIPASVRQGMSARMEAIGEQSFWSEPANATPEELEEFRERMAKMLVPDDVITTWVDVGSVLDRKWAAIGKHVTQMSPQNPFLRFGIDAWREFWGREAYILVEARTPATGPETDLFEGLG